MLGMLRGVQAGIKDEPHKKDQRAGLPRSVFLVGGLWVCGWREVGHSMRNVGRIA